jgi:hypothetical protein
VEAVTAVIAACNDEDDDDDDDDDDGVASFILYEGTVLVELLAEAAAAAAAGIFFVVNKLETILIGGPAAQPINDAPVPPPQLCIIGFQPSQLFVLIRRGLLLRILPLVELMPPPPLP